MDIHALCALATKATVSVLRYHMELDVNPHENGIPTVIGQTVHNLYHLRDLAHVQDTSVADLEIACDAALSAAEAYNSTRENQPKINLRWFYNNVQGLLLLDLKPELMLDDRVDRLSPDTQSHQPPQQQQPSQSSNGDGHSSSAGSPPSSRSSPERSAPSSSSDSSSSRTSFSAKRVRLTTPAKANWEDDEIRLMIQLRADGMRHSDIAARLGRGLGSIENKFGRVMHMDEWKKYYLTQVDAKIQENNKTKGSS